MGATCSRSPNIPRRVLIIGQSGAGKTQLLYSWVLRSGDFKATATVGFNVEDVTSNSGQQYIVWDLGGDDSFKHRHRQFFHGTDGFVYVADASRTDEYDLIKADFTRLVSERDLKELPFLVLINKCQSSESTIVEEWEQMLGLKDMDSRQWRIMAVSAMDESSSLKALDALDSLFVNS